MEMELPPVYDGNVLICLIMSLKSASDGSTTNTPEFNLSECFKLAQNFPHLKRSSMFLITIVSASRYTTAQHTHVCMTNQKSQGLVINIIKVEFYN